MKKAISIIIKIIAVYVAFMLIFFCIAKACLFDDSGVLVETHLVFSTLLYIYLGIRFAAETDIPRSKFYFYIPVAVSSGIFGFIVSRFAWYLVAPLDMLGKMIFRIEEEQKTEAFFMLELFLFTAVTGFVIYECLCAYRKSALKKSDKNINTIKTGEQQADENNA